MEYTPKHAPSLTLVYGIVGIDEPQTSNYPGDQAQVEITDILENGEPVSLVVYEALMSAHNTKWSDEILDDIEKNNK